MPARQEKHLTLGVYSGNGQGGMNQTRSLEKEMGQSFDILHVYTGFNQEFDAFQRENLKFAAAENRQILISWAPGVASGKTYEEIAKGSVDPYLHRWARGIKKFNRPVYLRFAYEMNMVNMGWYAGGNNGSAKDFVASWQHLHDIFAEEGVTNVTWVWCPHADTQSPNYTDAMRYYPGDSYVDWVGLDGYYWGGPAGQEAEAFDRIFKPVYDKLAARHKPIMIAEMGGANDIKDVANWHSAALKKITADYPGIQALVYFNQDFTSQGEKDWRLDVHRETLQRIRPYLSSKAQLSQAKVP